MVIASCYVLMVIGTLIYCSVKKIAPNNLTCTLVTFGGVASAIAAGFTPNLQESDVYLGGAILIVGLFTSMELMNLNLRHHFQMKNQNANSAVQ